MSEVENNNLTVVNIDDPEAIYEAIIKFQTLGNPHPEAENIWRWRYLDSLEEPCIITVAYDQQKIVGHSAMASVPFRGANANLKVGMVGGTMVDSEYRRQGIWRMVHNKEYQKANSNGIQILFGFPNKLALPAALKCGFFVHQVVEIVYKPLNLLKNLPFRNPRIFVINMMKYLLSRTQVKKEEVSVIGLKNKNIKVKEISSFGDESNILWEKQVRGGYVGIQKDVPYLRWRYETRPNTCFRAFVGFTNDEPTSLCVIEWDQSENNWNVGFISELFGEFLEIESALAVLKFAEKAAYSDHGIKGLLCINDGVSISGPVTSALGYNNNNNFRPIRVKVLDPKCMGEVLRPWHISMGDHMSVRGLTRG